jgi:hypothetical protein
MTEQEWQVCRQVRMLLSHIRLSASGRKVRLFACACCRLIWPHLIDERSQSAVVVAERFADGHATEEELRAACADASEVTTLYAPRESLRHAALAAAWAASAFPYLGATRTAKYTRAIGGPIPAGDRAQAELLRHIIGNPFRTDEDHRTFPNHVVQLAASLAEGGSGHFALHDALLEAGHPELADHIRDAPNTHPRGCWVLDLLLGKK